MRKLLILAIVFFSLSFSCEKETINPSDYESSISYGTSFGQCLGYCVKKLKITETKLDFEKSGWDLEKTLPVVRESESFNKEHWMDLIRKIDFDRFNQLDSIIGCPDCADGGAEWIEIRINGKTHKVVFEYHNEPQEVKNYLNDLRTYIGLFEIQPH